MNEDNSAEREAPNAGEQRTGQGQTELSDVLNDMLRDCQPVLRDELFFEQIDETAQLKGRKDRLNESLSITKEEHPGKGFMLFKPYVVERAVFVPGVRYTKNGDGWPDDTNIIDLGSFETPSEAFNFLIVEWFLEQIDRTQQDR